MVIYVFILAFILLLLMGAPVVYALSGTAIVSAIVMMGFDKIPLGVFAQRMISGMDSFTVIGIPLFLLAGKLMNEGTISDRIFNFAQSVVGHLPGGLGHVNILSSVIFAGMSGSAASDAAGLGQIEIRAMEKQGYDTEFSVAVTGASALVSPIIPPSVPMVTYAVIAGCSVTDMFIGGIIPGALMALGMGALVVYYAIKRGYPRGPKPTWQSFWTSFKEAFLSLLTPVIIIGGIWSGIFTPTEAAAVTVLYVLILVLIVYRCMSLKRLWKTLKEAVVDCGTIMFVMGAINMYSYILTRTRVPVLLANAITSITSSPMVVLLILNVFLLIIGCFMSTLEAILIFTPIFLPLLNTMGISTMVFGVIMCVNLMIGQLTPPFGTTLFVMTRISKLSMDRVVKAFLPFIAVVVVCVALLNLFPGLVTFLPNLFK